MSFKKTYVAPFSKKSAPLSADLLYWRKLTTPILLKEVNLIDNIDISQIEPHFIAVTCSSRVQLYHPITRMIHKNYNRFKEAAYGGVFRKDGHLLLTGSEEAALKLFDVSAKSLLRVFKGHQRAVHRCQFVPTDNQIVSFSDDKIVGLWDMPSEVLLHRFEGHTDYVRSGATLESNPNLIFSGSYDHTVRLWDRREKKELFNIDHGCPVEAILPSPTGSLLFTAGGTEIRIWDCLAGGRLLSKISQHHKTITCLQFASDFKRLASASLDRHVKIYDMTTFEVIQTMDYSSPILSLAIAPGDKTVAVGMSDGIIAISRMEDQEKVDKEAESASTMLTKRRKSKTFTDFILTDFGIKEEGTTQDLKYDHYLRKFRYSKALDCVMSEIFCYRFPATTVALFQELIRRNGLKQALAGRKGKPLIRILRFLIRHLRRPRFMRVLVQVSHELIDLYATKIGEDKAIDDLFLSLTNQVMSEVSYMTDLMELKGSLEMILVGCQASEGIPQQPIVSIVVPSNKLEPSENAKQKVVVSLSIMGLVTLEDLVTVATSRFNQEFNGTSPTVGACAPGRVNIIGEHTDYNGGFVLPMAIPLWTVVVGRPNATETVTLVTVADGTDTPDRIQFEIPTPDRPLTPGQPKWANYVKGVVQNFPGTIVPGFDACIVTTVPLGGGLSSSASLEVATCTFLEALTNTRLTPDNKALLCQKSEHDFAGVPCGIMDQLICCMAQVHSALLIDCKTLATTTVPLTTVTSTASFLVVNSNVKHELAAGEYAKRRDDCLAAASILGLDSLREATVAGLREKREQLGDRLYQRALHVVTEIERCQKAAQALAEGDVESAGRLMYQSHVSLRDLYQVSCPELDQLVDITMETKGVLGSRMTGGGFGGCIVALVQTSEVPNVMAAINQKYKKTPTTYSFQAVGGCKELSFPL